MYIYQADTYCDACGKDIRARLIEQGKVPADPDDECTYDSDDFPKGPFTDDEADTPQHCGSGDDCLDPLILSGEKYGKFLENELTSHGVEYVRELHRDRPSPLTAMWMKHYDLVEDEDEDE